MEFSYNFDLNQSSLKLLQFIFIQLLGILLVHSFLPGTAIVFILLKLIRTQYRPYPVPRIRQDFLDLRSELFTYLSICFPYNNTRSAMFNIFA